MATVKFYLKDSKAEKSSIYFFLNYGAYEIINEKKKYLPLKYYISESISPIHWNTKTGRAKQDKRFRQFPEFNARLQYIEDEVLSVLRRLQNDNTLINNDILKKELDLIFKADNDKTNKEAQILDFAERFKDISNISLTTKRSYMRVITDLKEYEQAKGIKLTFDNIDIDFHDSFIKYLQAKKYAPNTIGTRIKVIKTFMRASHERGLHNNTDYQKKAFSKPREETKAIYLNDEELSRLYNLDLSGNKKLESVRDWFIIASYTGLRFSDLLRLTKDDVKSDTIELKTQKTGTNIAVPLHTFVKSILDRYDYQLPKLISNQKFNEYIKTVAEIAEISDSVIVEETKGNMRTRKAEPKYSLISAHTARRSFATNAFLAGVPAIHIMKMTGHKTESAFLGYIKISAKENAKKLQLHPFFNKMIVK